MPKPSAFIGIDLGTSGCRAIAIDKNSDIIATVRIALAEHQQSKQEPAEHWKAVHHCLQDLIAQCCDNWLIQSIAVDATSGSVLLTNAAGKPITPLLMYHHTEAEQANIIAQHAPDTSGAHGAQSGLAKTLALLQATQAIPKRKLLHQADWINFNLGAPLGISDENNALKSGYDPIERRWPDWMANLLDISILPHVIPPGAAMGVLSEALTDEFKLSHAPTLIAGTTDSIAALMATGASQPGDAITSLGSTLVLKLISNKPIFLPKQGVYSHRFGEHWLVGGASNTGGAVLAHYFKVTDIASLSQQIDLNQTPPHYYPLLKTGERFPVHDPNKQPELTPRPDNDSEFLHGLIAGIARIEAQGYQTLTEAGASPINSITTVGGGANNPIWQTIRQQHHTAPITIATQTEAAYGAAQLALSNYP